MNDNWRIKHKELIEEFLEYLNDKSDTFILKGGTALMECYGLNRFSEDIDLDGPKGKNKEIDTLVETFAKERNIEFVHNKNTNTVDRYYLHYNGDKHPLKIETSFRDYSNNPANIVKINGIKTYEISTLTEKKLKAFDRRDKIRDLFDLIFICKNYWDKLDDRAKDNLRDSFSYKGIDYFDMIVETQKDDLIDKDKLASDFVDIRDKVGLSEDDDDDFIDKSDDDDKEDLYDSHYEVEFDDVIPLDDDYDPFDDVE